MDTWDIGILYFIFWEWVNGNDIGKDFTELDRDYFANIKTFVTCPLKLNTIGKLPYVAKK